MNTWFKLALRNLLKNRRRSFFTIGAVALGFAAVNLIGGFMVYVFKGLEESYVHAFGNGHLTVFKEGFQDEGRLDPAAYLFDGGQTEAILEACGRTPGVRLATPRLEVPGLLSNGEVSTIMIAEGRDPEASRRIRREAGGFVADLEMFEGADLADGGPAGIGVAHGLADKLDLGIGASVIVVANTAEGYMNALDASVLQLQDAPLEVLDEMLVTLPLSFARELYGTDGADRIVVLLEDGARTEAMRGELEAALRAGGLAVEVENWKDLRVSYRRIRNMFNVLFSFVFAVVMIIVVLSVVNTIGMAVMERTREIGTLRALGLKRRGVVVLFGTESALLGCMGVLLGAALHLCARQAILWWQPTWIPPNIPKRVPWEIAWAPEFLLASTAAMIVLSVLAAYLPARRAGGMEIIEALGHV